ncbi:hypothetical protein EDB19DRAFT_1714519 [Suillus lakei]|nr:hypothetical protein EDB19DRAFT_1714519 [Suillus lakei]
MTVLFETSSVSGITGCHRSLGSVGFFVQFLLSFGFQLVLISLTLIRAIRDWRTTHANLYVVLLKHNVCYYAYGLFVLTIHIVISLPLDYAYIGWFYDFQIIIHVMLATRMHLRLWHADRNRNANAFNAFTLSRVVLNEGTITIDCFSGVPSEIGSWFIGEIDPALRMADDWGVVVKLERDTMLLYRSFVLFGIRFVP